MAVPADDELEGLLEKFVCVRIVQMWGTDLSRFQFDGSLTWAIFFTNADGTIYGRYGSRSATGKLSEKEISLTGFKKSLGGALALHVRYTKDKDTVAKELAGKSSQAKPVWSRPEEIPALKSNPRFDKPFVGQRGRHGGCIHCHMFSTAELKSLREAGKPIPDRSFFPYPLPDELGFHMNPEEMATVQRVKPHSLAAKAGLEQGDRILRLQGQSILSTADLQWVIHNAGDKDTLVAEVSRKQEKKTLKLELPQDWRLGLSDWRFINMGLLRQTLGFNVNEMPKRRAQRLGLEGKMALLVHRTTRELRQETGLGNQDLIVAIDGRREPMTVGAFTRYVFRQKKPGSKLKLTLLQIVDRFPRPELEVEVVVR